MPPILLLGRLLDLPLYQGGGGGGSCGVKVPGDFDWTQLSGHDLHANRADL